MTPRIQAGTSYRVVLHYTVTSTFRTGMLLCKTICMLNKAEYWVEFSKETSQILVTSSISHNLQFIALLLSAPLTNIVFLNSDLKYCNDWYCCQRTNISPSFILSRCVCSGEKSGLCYVDGPYGLSERKIHFSCEQQHLIPLAEVP